MVQNILYLIFNTLFQGQILVLVEKLKIGDQRQEYGEQNINKLKKNSNLKESFEIIFCIGLDFRVDEI